MDGVVTGGVPGVAWRTACLLALAACTAEPPVTGAAPSAVTPDEVAEDRPVLPPTLPGLPGIRLPSLMLPSLLPPAAPAPASSRSEPTLAAESSPAVAAEPAAAPVVVAVVERPPTPAPVAEIAATPPAAMPTVPATTPEVPVERPPSVPAPVAEIAAPPPAAVPVVPATTPALAVEQASAAPEPGPPPSLVQAVAVVSPPAEATRADPDAVRPAAARGPIRVQLVAAGSEAEAMRIWSALAQRAPELAEGRRPVVLRAERERAQAIWRLRVGDFTTPEEAASYCARLRERGQACWVAG